MFYTYILELENKQYYTGYTKKLKTRYSRHFQSPTPTTTRIKPKDLIFYAAFKTKKKTLDFEKNLKGSSGFAFRNKRLILTLNFYHFLSNILGNRTCFKTRLAGSFFSALQGYMNCFETSS